MSESLYEAGDALMALAMVGILLFVASYAVFFRWRKTAAGRALMYFAGALALWAVQSTVTSLVGDYPMREVIRILVYFAIALGVWRMLFTLWTSWRHTPQKIKPRPSKDYPVVEDTIDPRKKD